MRSCYINLAGLRDPLNTVFDLHVVLTTKIVCGFNFWLLHYTTLKNLVNEIVPMIAYG